MHQSGRQQKLKMSFKSYFSFYNVGMPYLGLSVDLKPHLWHAICRPILTFGLNTVYLNRAMYGKLESLLLAQFSLYVHKGGLMPDSFHFISNRFRVQLLKLFLV